MPGEGNDKGRSIAWRLAAVGVLAGAFAALAFLARGPAVPPADQALAAAVVSLRGPALTGAFWILTVIGNAPVMTTLVATAAMALIVWGRPRSGAVLAASMAGGWVVVEALKVLFGRVRPPGAIALIETPASHSFPSGHAFHGLVFFTLAAILLARASDRPRARLAVPAAGAAIGLGVGLSRIYLGVHWPSDVVASWTLGAAWLLVAAGAAAVVAEERPSRLAPGARRRAIAASVALAAVAATAVVLGAAADPLVG